MYTSLKQLLWWTTKKLNLPTTNLLSKNISIFWYSPILVTLRICIINCFKISLKNLALLHTYIHTASKINSTSISSKSRLSSLKKILNENIIKYHNSRKRTNTPHTGPIPIMVNAICNAVLIKQYVELKHNTTAKV